MTVKEKYLVDVFGLAVADVRERYDLENKEKPYYLHGHPLEILKILSDRDTSKNWKYRKYPLVALLQDFEEDHDNLNPILAMKATVRVLIVNQTKREYSSVKRYDEKFKPILYPIYELLLEAIAEIGYFNYTTPDQIPVKKWDRLFWGREGLYGSEGNVFSDNLDAIDIKFTGLEVNAKAECVW